MASSLGRILRRAAGVGLAGGVVTLAAAGHYADQLVDADPHEALLAPALLSTPFTRTRHITQWRLPAGGGVETAVGLLVPLTYDEYHRASNLYRESRETPAVRNAIPDDNPPNIVKGTCVFIAPPSFVSSRSIFLATAALAADHFILTETPGYGANARRGIGPQELTGATLTSGLERMLEDIAAAPGTATPINVVAAGHAAPYLADIARRRPELFDRLVLLNPTMSGPLPSAHNKSSTSATARTLLSGMMSAAWAMYQVPLLGPGLHFLTQTQANIERQLRTHVYARAENITAENVRRNQVFARTGTPLPKCAFLVGKCDTEATAFAFALQDAKHMFLLMGTGTRCTVDLSWDLRCLPLFSSTPIACVC